MAKKIESENGGDAAAPLAESPEKLEACPMCGGKARMVTERGEFQEGRRINCIDRACGVSTPLVFRRKLDGKLIEAADLSAKIWNTRKA